MRKASLPKPKMLATLTMALLLLTLVPPALSAGATADRLTVDVDIPSTVNVGETVRIFVTFQLPNGSFVDANIRAAHVVLPNGSLVNIPGEFTRVHKGWFYIDFSLTDQVGTYGVMVVATTVVDGTLLFGSDVTSFSTTLGWSIATLASEVRNIASIVESIDIFIRNFRDEVVVTLEKQFLLTRDILGSAIAERTTKLSIEIAALDEKVTALTEETIKGFEAVISSLDALSSALTVSIESLGDSLTDTIESSTTAIKSSLASAITATLDTIKSSTDAIQDTIASSNEDITSFIQSSNRDLSDILPTLFGILALIVLLSAIAATGAFKRVRAA